MSPRDASVVCGVKRGLTREVARVARRRHGDKAMSAYRCPVCNWWHVGSSASMATSSRKQLLRLARDEETENELKTYR